MLTPCAFHPAGVTVKVTWSAAAPASVNPIASNAPGSANPPFGATAAVIVPVPAVAPFTVAGMYIFEPLVANEVVARFTELFTTVAFVSK